VSDRAKLRAFYTDSGLPGAQVILGLLDELDACEADRDAYQLTDTTTLRNAVDWWKAKAEAAEAARRDAVDALRRIERDTVSSDVWLRQIAHDALAHTGGEE
jgi:hypothetical protein